MILISARLQRDTLVSLDTKIHSFKYSFREASEETDNLNAIIGKIEGEIAYLKQQLETLQEKKDHIRQEYYKYSQLLTQNDEEIAKLGKDNQALLNEISNTDKHVHLTQKAVQKLEADIKETLNEQLSIQKGAQGSKRDTSKLRAQLNEKEASLIQAQNEIAGTSLEIMTIMQIIEQHKMSLIVLNDEYSTQNKLIEKHELEMKRRTDEVTKKQSEIDILNKKYDTLMKNLDESTGPLESIIKNLTRDINNKEKEGQQLQNFWLRAQNELVVLVKRCSEINDEIQSMKMKLNVLSRKKLVLDSKPNPFI